MIETVVTFLLSNMNALLREEADHLLRVDDRIRSVRDQLEWIRPLLNAADQKRQKNEGVNVWVNQIRDAAYDVEDTMDTYILTLERHRQGELALGFLPIFVNICGSGFLSIFEKLYVTHQVGSQLKKIHARLDEIWTNKTKYGLDLTQSGESSTSSSTNVTSKERRAPSVEETNVVGFKEDADKLANDLLTEETQRRAVVSIVGVGGLGKTTLANHVYNRSDVMNAFEVRAWVYVSQEYEIRDLLLNITTQVIGSLGRQQEMEMDEEALKSKLLANLRGKRYLIVLDDIWTKEAWDLIRKAFPDEENASRIMLTTRNLEVALYADPSSNLHDLHLLDDDESWQLFCQKAFPNSSCPRELEKLGKKIVAEAGGLPLAILVLGGLLSTKQKTHSVWQKALESANWHLSEGSKQCLQVLALSYNDLPYYLKSCFLYFGMYPEDVYIEADRLIRLWISEGFIQVRGEETLEDVAEDCLEELVQRSMVQVAKRRDDGIIESCRIHDLLRDLAILEAKKGRFLEIYESHCSIEACRPRRLANHFGKGMLDTNLKYTAENLRSFLCFSYEGPEKNIWASFFGHFKLLRVLDLCGINYVELPEEIGKLILLKYLAACGNSDVPLKVPTSIENLINLQTLDLKESTTVTPDMLRNMHHLRHVFCGSIHPEDNTHESNRIDHLRDLQTLEVKYSIWMDGFEKLTSLRRLSISMGLEGHSKLSDSLANFQRLRSLSLPNFSCSTLVPLVSFSHHMHLTEMMLGTLQKIPDKEDFPPNLVSLKVFRLQPEESVDPMATLEKLPNLRTLEIDCGFYIGRRITCSRGGFANLQHLAMSHLHDLEEWIVEEGAMPNLRSLYMRRCSELKVIYDPVGHIANLKDVRFVRMKNLRVQYR